MIIRSISICLRCQKGGEPASKVYMITPVLHLRAAQREPPALGSTPGAPSRIRAPRVARCLSPTGTRWALPPQKTRRTLPCVVSAEGG